MADNQTIIIKKIKKGGHGHHGGAWKIAYADFVTAMMAFFLLLWLLSAASEETLKGLAEYFTPTIGLKDQEGVGIAGGASPTVKDGTKRNDAGTDAIIYGAPSEGSVIKSPDEGSVIDNIEEQNFTNVLNDLEQAFKKDATLEEFSDQVIVDMTPEGLRIQIIDDADRPMFKPNTNELQPYMMKILTTIGNVVKLLPNYISIAGHTRSLTPEELKRGVNDEGRWVLSANRADVVRSYLVNGHIDPEQVIRIVGKADQEPFEAEDPSSVRNIRTSIVLLRNSLVGKDKQSAPAKLFK